MSLPIPGPPQWRAHGFDLVLNSRTGIILNVPVKDRDWFVAALNLCDGATVGQLHELRALGVTPAQMIGATAYQGKEATIIAITDWIKKKGGQLP